MDVVDDRGKHVVLAHPPERIVTLLPSHTEMLFALGVGDRVVGRDTFSDRPPAVTSVPAVGDQTPHVEAILALHPDLVICDEYGSQAPPLESAGLVVWAGSAQTYDQMFTTILSLGNLVGRPEQAVALNARIRHDVEAARSRTTGLPVASVYYEVDRGYSVGPRSYVGSLLAMAGGRTIVGEGLGDYPRFAPEEVLARDPDVILGMTVAEAKERPGWSTLRAVQAGRVYRLTPAERDSVVRVGPSAADGIRALQGKLHP